MAIPFFLLIMCENNKFENYTHKWNTDLWNASVHIEVQCCCPKTFVSFCYHIEYFIGFATIKV